MARLFLSYAREDSAKARSIAIALEKAGNEVWWDNHIRGGTEYTREIEQALDAADAVVVLWSVESIESAWVRDEAAVGRDRGRLVPVRLDDTDPPMGFRQFQTIDFDDWKGRGKPPRLPELLEAISGIAGADNTTPPDAPPAKPAARRSPPERTRLAIIVFSVFAVLGLAYWLLGRYPAKTVPVVAVTSGDRGEASRALADDMLSSLEAYNRPIPLPSASSNPGRLWMRISTSSSRSARSTARPRPP